MSNTKMDFLNDGYYGLVVCRRGKGTARTTPDRIVQLKDGSLLLIHGRSGGRADEAQATVMGKKSTDGGRTWGRAFVIFHNEGRMCSGAGGWMRLGSGKIGLAPCRMNDYDDMKNYFCFSADEAKTFSEPVLITPRPGYNCPCNGRLIQLDSGRLIYPIAYTPRSRAKDENYSVLVYYSDDEGTTWRESESELKLPKRGGMEPVIAEIRDGRCMMLIRTQLGRQYQSFSENGGQTWTDPEPSPLVSPEAGAYLIRIPSTGDLLACWNYDFKPRWHHRHYGLRCPLTTAVSKDAGKTWLHVHDLEDDHRYSFGNPTITFVNGYAYTVYYRGRVIDEWGIWDTKLTIVPETFFYRDQPLNRAAHEIPQPTTPRGISRNGTRND